MSKDGQRYLIASGVSCYDKLPVNQQLDSVPNDIERVVTLFESFDYERVLAELGNSPTEVELRTALSEWFFSDERHPSDIVVLYHSGHGAPDREGNHYLFASDTDPDPRRMPDTAFEADALGRFIAESKVNQVLVILDTCYSGAGAGRIQTKLASLASPGLLDPSSVDPDYRAGVWLLSAALPTQRAKENVFSKALEQAVTQLLDDSSATAQFITLDQLADTMNDLISVAGSGQVVQYDVSGGTGSLHFLPNLLYREHRLDLLNEYEFRAHWSPASRGMEEGDEGSRFTGREAALRRIVHWLEPGADQPDLLVVTSDPGSGKSAVIGRVVTLADEQTRQQLSIDNITSDTIPPLGAFDAVIYARAKSLNNVVRELATRAGVQSEHQGDLVEALKERTEPFVIAVDALDEAVEADEIARLLRLIAGSTSVRILVGTKRSQLDRLGTATEIIDLDDPQYFDRHDVETYVTLQLLAAGTPYCDRPDAAHAVANKVATAAGRTFLIARLVAKALCDRSEPVDVEHHQFPSSVRAAFDEYLQRFGENEERVRDLLEPLSWAEGRGFPTRRIWPEVASALSGKNYGPTDIRWLTNEARDLLVRDVEDDRPVFRLFHGALVAYLRRPGDQSSADVQSDIVDALRNTLQQSADEERRWFEAHPYVRRYFAGHAAAANRLDEFVTVPWFLAAAEPRNLLPVLRACSKESAQVAAIVYQEVSDRLLVTETLVERLSYIHLSAKQQGADFLADQLSNSHSMPWRTQWVHWQAMPRLRLTHPFQVARTMTVIRRHAQDVVACGMNDGSIILWQLSDRAAQADLSIDHGSTITALCSGRFLRQDAIISGGIDGSLCAWSLQDGSLIYRWEDDTEESGSPSFISSLVSQALHEEGDAEPIDAMVAFMSDKPPLGAPSVPMLRIVNSSSLDVIVLNVARLLNVHSQNPTVGWRNQSIPLAAVESHKNRILVAFAVDYGHAIFDFATGEIRGMASIGETTPIEVDEKGHTERMTFTRNGMRTETTVESAVVTALAFGARSGETVLLSGDQYGEIRVWSADETGRISLPKMQHASTIESRMITALAPISGLTQELVASGDSEGRILFWDLVDGQAVEPGLEFDDEIVTIKACRHRDGLELVVLTANGTVSVVDVDKAQRSRRKRDLIPVATNLSASPHRDDRTLWSRHEDGWIRMWNAQDGSLSSNVQFGDGRAESFIPVDFQGSPGVVFTADGSRSLELERLDDGKLTRTRHEIGDQARALSCAYVNGTLCVVAGGERVQAWHVVDGKPLSRVLPKNRREFPFYSYDHVTLAQINGEWIVLAIFPPRSIRRWLLRDRELIEPDIVLGTNPNEMTVSFGGGEVNERQITSFVNVAGSIPLIIAGDSEGSLWGWEFDSAKLVFQFPDLHLGPVGALTVLEMESELLLVTGGSSDGYVNLIGPPGDLKASVCLRSSISSIMTVGQDILVATAQGMVSLKVKPTKF